MTVGVALKDFLMSEQGSLLANSDLEFYSLSEKRGRSEWEESRCI